MSDFGEREYEVTGTGIELRTAGSDDGDLSRRIVALAGHWQATEIPHELAPELDKYHQGWGRAGDIGVFAFQGVQFAGGACVRQFGPTDGAYGYIDQAYPELCIGIEPGFRRRGLGALLLAALKAKVIDQGVSGISLSVAPDNGAQNLYRQMGFELIEDRTHDLLMLWRR